MRIYATTNAILGLCSVTRWHHSLSKVKAVRQYPVPKNTKDVRSFLGLALFYRRLVPKFTEIAKPLTELIRMFSSNGKDASKQLLRS